MSMFFPFDRLPTELRLEIWAFAVQSDARRRLVIEQNFQVFPTLDLVASPFFSVNIESREAVRSFYPIRLEVFRRSTPRPNPSLNYNYNNPTAAAASENENGPQQSQRPAEDYRGVVYLSPALDTMVSVHPRTELLGLNDMNFFGNFRDPATELVVDRSERSKTTAWRHRSTPMSEETRRLFRRYPNRWCLLRHASRRLRVHDWLEVHDWLSTFGGDEYRSALGLLRSMRINSLEFTQVFGW
ncbi:hypothetical protein HD806DRAFT_495178 [Xylariaceae sp. AK1471]|nr:hypothetical protein HD806DRAFT_495178 [Xylariaceae sp. AK1471]